MARHSNLNKFYLELVGVFAAGFVAIALIFAVIIPWVRGLNRPAYLDVMVRPSEAMVEIAGQEYRNAMYELEPGNYTATVTLEGANPLTVELDMVQGETTGLYLAWRGDEWKQFGLEDLARRDMVKELMPIETAICGTPAKRTNCDAITVRYERNLNCGEELCLVITGRRAELTDEVISLVRDKLSEGGYDLNDYKYIYFQDTNK